MAATTATTTPSGRRFYISLRVKLLIAFTLLFSLVFAGAFAWFYNYSTEAATDRILEDLNTLLAGTVAQIDGDEFQALVAEAEPEANGYPEDQRYWDHAQWLFTIRNLDDRARVYTLAGDVNTGETFYVGSSSALRTPPSGAQFKEDCGDCPDTLRVLSTGENVYQLEPYTDSFGFWVSGYTPIRNSASEVVGVLGMDYLGNYVVEVQNGIKNNIVLAFVLVYGFLFLTVFFISRLFTRGVRALTGIAQRIGEGDYDQDLSSLTSSTFPDEITTLAQVFDTMTHKVEKREVALKERVAELEITLDLSKRDQQVSEIVDSDFFQDLQSKAREMRNRKSGRELPKISPVEES